MDDSEYIDKIADSLTRTINALSTLANGACVNDARRSAKS